VRVWEERGSEKEEKIQGTGQATAGHHMTAGAAIPSAGGDGQPSPGARFFNWQWPGPSTLRQPVANPQFSPINTPSYLMSGLCCL